MNLRNQIMDMKQPSHTEAHLPSVAEKYAYRYGFRDAQRIAAIEAAKCDALCEVMAEVMQDLLKLCGREDEPAVVAARVILAEVQKS